MSIYALIFYVLTFAYVGEPNNAVISHELRSWKHPYQFESKELCEKGATAIRLQQPNPNDPGYKTLCEPVNKQSLR